MNAQVKNDKASVLKKFKSKLFKNYVALVLKAKALKARS